MARTRLTFKGVRRSLIHKFINAIVSLEKRDDLEAARHVANPDYAPVYFIIPGSSNRTNLDALKSLAVTALTLRS